jgi:hypothetical protein
MRRGREIEMAADALAGGADGVEGDGQGGSLSTNEKAIGSWSAMAVVC